MQSSDADFKNIVIKAIREKESKLCHDLGHGQISKESRDETIGRVRGLDDATRIIEDCYKRLYSEQR